MKSTSIQTWKWLRSPDAADLLAAAEGISSGELQAIARLRKRWNAEQVGTAIELLGARQRAQAKFPSHPPDVCDRSGIEQATPEMIAEYKASRIHETVGSTGHVADLACGIGGDAMSLARRMKVTGIDTDPVRCWMTGVNAGCEVANVDATSFDARVDVFHLDPGRRDERTGRRFRSPDTWNPPLHSIGSIGAGHEGGVVKLGPGIALDDVPMLEEAELEFVSIGAQLSQAHLWMGSLTSHPGQRRATLLPHGLTECGTPSFPELHPEGTFDGLLCIPNPALERSGLHGPVGSRFELLEPVAGLGILTGDTRPDSPWFTSFEVDAIMPWREQKVRSWLRANDTSHVEIKTRDQTVDPDALQKLLSGEGSIPRTVFVLRMGRPVVAIMTRRVDTASASIEPNHDEDDR